MHARSVARGGRGVIAVALVAANQGAVKGALSCRMAALGRLLLRNTSVFGYDGLAVRRFSRRSTDYKSVVPVFLTHCAGPPGEKCDGRERPSYARA